MHSSYNEQWKSPQMKERRTRSHLYKLELNELQMRGKWHHSTAKVFVSADPWKKLNAKSEQSFPATKNQTESN